MSEVVDVLVVDDERINLRLVQGILKGYDLNLVLAESASEALDSLADHDYAVALLDVMMPGMNGFELAEELRSSEVSRNIPIIFITAISKEQRHIFRGYELGAVDYLIKPVEPEVLRGKTNIFADLHRKKRSLEETTRRLEATVAELEDSQKALRESEKRYRMVADYNYDWEIWFAPDGNIHYMSPSCERISGYSPDQFQDDPDLIRRIIHREDLPGWTNFLGDGSLDDEKSLDFRISDAGAKIKWLSMVRHAIHADDGENMGIRVSMRDITNRKAMERQLEFRALHDSLTGLPNRGLFVDRVDRALERSVEAENWLAVMFINLDRFQAVNEHYGHAMGDKLMVAIAVRLQKVVRSTDTVARFGSDEFGILLESIPRKSDIRDLVNDVLDSFKKPLLVDGSEFLISAAIGYEIASGGGDGEEMVHNSQVAMNEAKKRGKGRVVPYSKKMREGVVNVLAMEQDLKRGIEAREFEPYFQPIVNLADGTLYGFETLTRWNHPERGMVSPGEFIPVAEDTGLIVELGSQILEEACVIMEDWRRKYDLARDLSIAVNISARQFAGSTLAPAVERILANTGLPARCLKLEITETVVMLDAVKSVNQLNILKKLGVMLSIDDFGTGYSSMSYLQKFPTDQLKIDLSFVQRMEAAAENIEIVRAIVNMAHSLRLRVVAEGIESERQRDLLYSLQCDYGQGYLYSRPLPRGEAEDFVKNSE